MVMAIDCANQCFKCFLKKSVQRENISNFCIDIFSLLNVLKHHHADSFVVKAHIEWFEMVSFSMSYAFTGKYLQ